MSFGIQCSSEDQEFSVPLDLFSDIIIILRSASNINIDKLPLWLTFSRKSRLWYFSLLSIAEDS